MAAMPKRQLGKDGPHVSALGFGVMGLSAYYGKADPDEDRYKVLDRALELGITLWDSADVYGDSEELLGRWFARTGKRDEVFLATKFAMVRKDDGGLGVRSDPEYVKQACERSLKRLGVPHIDLYYCHRCVGFCFRGLLALSSTLSPLLLHYSLFFLAATSHLFI
jgi:aryl-alcohol dehydrogenase-like predicted oxidoreductase